MTEAKAHPGMLVKVGSVTYYVNSDNKLQTVSDTGVTANGFQTKFVRTLTDAAIAGLVAGDAVTAEVKAPHRQDPERWRDHPSGSYWWRYDCFFGS